MTKYRIVQRNIHRFEVQQLVWSLFWMTWYNGGNYDYGTLAPRAFETEEAAMAAIQLDLDLHKPPTQYTPKIVKEIDGEQHKIDKLA